MAITGDIGGALPAGLVTVVGGSSGGRRLQGIPVSTSNDATGHPYKSIHIMFMTQVFVSLEHQRLFMTAMTPGGGFPGG
jgi:hypothetical protein